MSAPNVKETPRSFSPQPWICLSGSDHKRSHKRPIMEEVRDLRHPDGGMIIIEMQSHHVMVGQRFNLPWSGTSVGRTILRICSIVLRSGDKPPCIQNIFSSIIAAIGRQLKHSVKVFQSLTLYLRLPKETKMNQMKRYALEYKNMMSIVLVSVRTFIIETIYSVNRSTFVVAS